LQLQGNDPVEEEVSVDHELAVALERKQASRGRSRRFCFPPIAALCPLAPERLFLDERTARR